MLVVAALAVTAAGCGDDDRERVADPSATGAFAVGHATSLYVDGRRGDRPLPVNIWYPADAPNTQGLRKTLYELAPGIGLESANAVDGAPLAAGAHPLVIFSHGFGGIGTQSTDLVETLASHGFVVVSAEHTGNTQMDMSDSFDEAAANRVPDVTFLIDTMFARSLDSDDGFFAALDQDAVGVIGHSFGGMTAIGAAAGWAGARADPRVGAIVPISAVVDKHLQSDERTGPNAGFSAAQLAAIEVPVMLLGGTEDTNVFIENNAIAFEQMYNASHAYKVDIIGATHNHFANVCAIGNLLLDLGIGIQIWPNIGAGALVPIFADTCTADVFPIDEAKRLQNLYAVSFFKRHLLGARGYDRFLSAGYADTEPAIALQRR
jgi:predicted dienelactone hydrolase